jgi:hypothetical protein
MRPKLQKHSVLELAGRINETQILQTQCSNIYKLNYPVCKAHRDIPHKRDTVPSSLLRNVSKACFVVHTRDLSIIICEKRISVVNSAQPVIGVRNLKKSFGSFTAVNDISFIEFWFI